MKRSLNVLLAVLVSILLTVAPSQAITMIDFGTGSAGQGGIITVNGSDYTGANIRIGSLTVDIDGVSATYATNAFLNFDTVADTISITGSIAALNIVNNVLLSGSFYDFSNSFATPFMVSFQATGPDLKSPELLAALGIPLNTQFEFFGFSIGGRRIPKGNRYEAISTDILNTSLPVPEPATLLFLGTGLLGIGLVGRRLKGWNRR